MLRKISIIIAVMLISAFCLNGCKKRADEIQPDTEAIKTTAEYEAEAKEQINKENMAEELNKIEKSLEQDTSNEK